MKRALLPLGVFLVLAAFLALGLNLDPRLVPSPLVGRPAPQFTAPSLTDPEQTVSRADLAGGGPVLVNVFASWCLPCLDEHPQLLELARRGVAIVGLNYKNRRQDALDWLDRHGNPYAAIAYDPDGRVGLEWGVYGVPETFVLDRQGIVRHKHVGPLDRTALQAILPWLAEAP
ncbi:MAG: DsbE family thiol:disulfide interchange protein [Pseudomonadota bacterium]|nr:DsbE family thiol:disulfide interchange protein [Pseudomonadota bacterium]